MRALSVAIVTHPKPEKWDMGDVVVADDDDDESGVL